MDNAEKKYTYEDFLKIMATLRGENGCPWDKVQTHDSLKPCMTEEAAELLAAIRIYDRTGNPENMREELGDVLLQVVMHALIASEEGLFTMEDVVDEVSRKMIRRHPHVFGTGSADTPEEVLVNWEEIKKEEKKDKEWVPTPLREVPVELPALTRAAKVLKKADKYYGYSSSYEQDVGALAAAVQKLQGRGLQEQDQELEQILADMLMRVSDIARLAKISHEQALADRVDDFIEQYEKTAP